MLDVLEQFLNYHGHIYLRLDGNTRVEQRQVSPDGPVYSIGRDVPCLFLHLCVYSLCTFSPLGSHGAVQCRSAYFLLHFVNAQRRCRSEPDRC